MFIEILGLLLAFVVILLLCFYTTKLIGKKFNGGTRNKVMKIIETLPLGLDKSLYLIRVGKSHYLFFSSKKGMELVSEVNLDDILQEVSNHDNTKTNVFDFKSIFDTYSGLSDKESRNNASSSNSEMDQSKPTGIIDGIKRLKNINSQRKN